MRDRGPRAERLHGRPAYLVACSRGAGGRLQPAAGEYARCRPGPAAGEEDLQRLCRWRSCSLCRCRGQARSRCAPVHDGAFARRDGGAEHGAGFPRGGSAARRDCHHRHTARHGGNITAVQPPSQLCLWPSYAERAETARRRCAGHPRRHARGRAVRAKHHGIRRAGHRADGGLWRR